MKAHPSNEENKKFFGTDKKVISLLFTRMNKFYFIFIKTLFSIVIMRLLLCYDYFLLVQVRTLNEMHQQRT